MKTKVSHAHPAANVDSHNLPELSPRKHKSLLFCLLLLVSAGAFAGDDSKAEKLDWKLDATVKGVQFYHAVSDCSGRQVAFLKFVNNNSYAVNVSWKESVKTQLRTEENLLRGGQQLSLPPGETLADNCSANCKACMLVSEAIDPTYVAQIVSYSFKNISVVK